MSYQDQIIDVEVVVKLVGPTLVPLLEPGEMYCWASEEGAHHVSQIIINALAALDPALANVWRLHDMENKSYTEITRIKGLTRGQARQRQARAARQLRRSFVKSDARRKLAHAIGVTEVPYGVLDLDWCSVKAVVAETGYSASHLRYLIKQEKVTAQKIRGKWLLSRHSMNEYISRKKKKNNA